jgi:hypothetical protein
MGWIKRIAALLLGLSLAACGGGGDDAGTSPFGSAASAPGSGNPGPAPGGGISVVSSGVPSQKYMSMSVETYNQDWSFDGDTTTLTVRVADSAGNPVPEGTVVQFSTEGGQIQKSCQLTGSTATGSTLSACSVTFGTQELRPLDNLVAVVAWLEGEEAYADLNGNGVYDSGEPFYDAGKIFRDDDHSNSYTANLDEINVGGTVGTPALGVGSSDCAANAPTNLLNDIPLSVTNTCDGTWGKTLVRATRWLALSDPRALGINVLGAGQFEVFSQFHAGGFQVAAPAGTTVSVLTTLPSGCTVAVTPATVPPTAIGPTTHALTTTGTTCPSAVTVKVTSGAYEVIRNNVPL